MKGRVILNSTFVKRKLWPKSIKNHNGLTKTFSVKDARPLDLGPFESPPPLNGPPSPLR